MTNLRVLVVGAGFAGAVIARECAEAGHAVHVIDRRPHIGGNAHDAVNIHGERIHLYGPHLLHGEKDSVAIRWLSRFTDWVPYEHRVRALLADGRTTPLPVNRTTLEDVFGVTLASDDAAKALLASQVTPLQPVNTDEVFLANVGPRLADLFFRPYTRKMWGVCPTELEAAVGARLPVRSNRDDRYFTDSFQAMPKDGFTAMFSRIFDHPAIEVTLGEAYGPEHDQHYDHVFLSLPIDEYFQFRFGRLPYRSIRFESDQAPDDQAATVINYTDTGIYTRCTQWDLIPNSNRRTDGQHTITREIPCDATDNNNECYYPVRNRQSLALYERYRDLAAMEANKTFIGRCGLFRYIDMVPCVTIHLQLVGRFLDGDSLPHAA
ncbi:MAG: UDP-galactopyranose mutase Glf [Cyanobacteriota bacterium]